MKKVLCLLIMEIMFSTVFSQTRDRRIVYKSTRATTIMHKEVVEKDINWTSALFVDFDKGTCEFSIGDNYSKLNVVSIKTLPFEIEKKSMKIMLDDKKWDCIYLMDNDQGNYIMVCPISPDGITLRIPIEKSSAY